MKLKVNLQEIGINYNGSLNDSNFLSEVKKKIYNSHSEDYWIDERQLKLRYIETVDHGAYGMIALCRREVIRTEKENAPEGEWVFAKIPIHRKNISETEKECLLWESCIQLLIRRKLEKSGFPNGAPKVIDIFQMANGCIGYTMEILYGAKPLDRILAECVEPQEFREITKEAIYQISSMISILERDLGFNHRDLKTSNLLCRKVRNILPMKLVIWDEITKTDDEGNQIVFKRYEMIVRPQYEYTIIDFGFSCFGACRGCGEFKLKNKIYTIHDPCPKPGRDMFIFLAFLFAEFSHKMDEKQLRVFRKWLHRGCGIELPLTVARPGAGLYEYLAKNGLKGIKYIYWIARNFILSSIKPTNAIKIVEDLLELE